MADITKTITTTTQSLFTHIGLSVNDITITAIDEAYEVNLTVAPEASGILIGYHGETISALQFLLSLMVHNQVQVWHRLIVNINDYRQKREQSLAEMAKAAAQRVRSTGEEVIMPPMESFDRRIVHTVLAADSSVRTESVGEGRDRRLIIYPASPSA